jgi:hypothetical protein
MLKSNTLLIDILHVSIQPRIRKEEEIDYNFNDITTKKYLINITYCGLPLYNTKFLPCGRSVGSKKIIVFVIVQLRSIHIWYILITKYITEIRNV